MTQTKQTPWRASLHGGHSSAYCDHASSTLEEMLDAAVAAGMSVFGVTEHAPRVEPERLYDEELALGWTVEHLGCLFDRYAAELDRLIPRYADRLAVLKGFEAEIVPEGRYREVMTGLRERLGFDYIVGSVHYVAGHIIDYKEERFARAVEACGGVEAACVQYYRNVAEMAETLRPEVVGHFDLVRQRFPDDDSAAPPAVRRAALEALGAVRDCGAILDINTGGLRKGFGHPYPAPWIVGAAHGMGIPMCFGDDSHSAAQVGYGLDAARDYLLALGVDTVTVLEPGTAGLNRRVVQL